MTDTLYRVEQQADGQWHLFLRHAKTGAWYEFWHYPTEESARYDGYLATLPKARTDTAVRLRRQWTRSI